MTDMHNKNIRLIDQGWDAMHATLDIEMPVKKDKKRFFLWWLMGFGLLLITAAAVLFGNTSLWNTGQLSKDESALITEVNDATSPINKSATQNDNLNQNKNDQSLSSDLTTSQSTIITKETTQDRINNNQASTSAASEASTTHQSDDSPNKESLQSKSIYVNDLTGHPDQQASSNAATNEIKVRATQTAPIISKTQNNTPAPLKTKDQVPSTTDDDKSNIATRLSQTDIPENVPSSINPQAEISGPTATDRTLLQEALDQKTDFVESNIQESSPTEANQVKSILIDKIAPLTKSFLSMPKADPLEMTIKTASKVAPTVETFKPYTALSLGAMLSYLHQQKTLGYGINGAISLQLSQRWSIATVIEYGRYQITPQVERPSILNPTDSQFPSDMTTDNAGAPAGPAGSPEDVAEDMAGGASVDPGEETFRNSFTPEEITEFRRISLARLSYFRPSIQTRYAFSNTLSGTIGIGVEHLFQGHFDESKLSNLDVFSATTIDEIEDLPLVFQPQWIPSIEAGLSYHLASSYHLSLSHRYFTKDLYMNADQPIKLHQVRLGMSYTIPLRRRE